MQTLARLQQPQTCWSVGQKDHISHTYWHRTPTRCHPAGTCHPPEQAAAVSHQQQQPKRATHGVHTANQNNHIHQAPAASAGAGTLLVQERLARCMYMYSTNCGTTPHTTHRHPDSPTCTPQAQSPTEAHTHHPSLAGPAVHTTAPRHRPPCPGEKQPHRPYAPAYEPARTSTHTMLSSAARIITSVPR